MRPPVFLLKWRWIGERQRSQNESWGLNDRCIHNFKLARSTSKPNRQA